MTLFHGTANYNLDSFLKNGVILHVRRDYDRPSFCTSLSFKEASFFAFRKTPIDDKEFKNCGIILEFSTINNISKNEDYKFWIDTKALRNEREVIILNRNIINLIAFYKFSNNNWVRIVLQNMNQMSGREGAIK